MAWANKTRSFALRAVLRPRPLCVHCRALQTIARFHEHEIDKIKGSRFIGMAFPMQAEETAGALLEKAAEKYPRANHYTFAYRMKQVERMSDDGEPALTAGTPILRQIGFAGLDNVMVIVVRYFGGTKLGKGGLSRAYGQAARAVLDEAEVVEHVPREMFELIHAHEMTGHVMKRLKQDQRISIEDTQYLEDGVRLQLSIPTDDAAAFEGELLGGGLAALQREHGWHLQLARVSSP